MHWLYFNNGIISQKSRKKSSNFIKIVQISAKALYLLDFLTVQNYVYTNYYTNLSNDFKIALYIFHFLLLFIFYYMYISIHCYRKSGMIFQTRSRIFCRVFGRIPPSMHLVANVCLNEWIENFWILNFSAISDNLPLYAENKVGLPFLSQQPLQVVVCY